MLIENKDKELLKYVPEQKLPAIKAIWYDEDGYWIVTHNNWYAMGNGLAASIINTKSIPELQKELDRVEYID